MSRRGASASAQGTLLGFERAVDEALPAELDRREIAFAPVERIALAILRARRRANAREHLIDSAQRRGRPERNLVRARANREAHVAIAVVDERLTDFGQRGGLFRGARERELAARVVRETELIAADRVIRDGRESPQELVGDRRRQARRERRRAGANRELAGRRTLRNRP